MLSKKQDFILMLVWPLVSVCLLEVFSLSFIWSVMFFYIIPSVYISTKIPGQIKKTMYFALTGAILWSTLDYIWELTNAWKLSSILQYKFLGVISVEAPIWSFTWIYFIVIVYEYFFERDLLKEKTKTSTHEFLLINILGFVGLLVLVIFFRANLSLPYSYLILGTLTSLLPSIIILLKYPDLRGKFFSAGIYFFYATLAYELVALHLKHWWFPTSGKFIGSISILNLSFPIEEGFLWVLVGSLSVMSWYELLDDDHK